MAQEAVGEEGDFVVEVVAEGHLEDLVRGGRLPLL